MGLSLYRAAQEAMANVRKHSTARSATVTLRVVRGPATLAGKQFAHGFAEVEVLDDGRPRRGTSGSGLGLLGIRERAATHQGVVEIGPRATGGFRVRMRLPLPVPDPVAAAVSPARRQAEDGAAESSETLSDTGAEAAR
jgi:signal transduction histidine kinase